jgi:hypothetical protein
MNQAGSRKIDDTIYLYPDAAAAHTRSTRVPRQFLNWA